MSPQYHSASSRGSLPPTPGCSRGSLPPTGCSRGSLPPPPGCSKGSLPLPPPGCSSGSSLFTGGRAARAAEIDGRGGPVEWLRPFRPSPGVPCGEFSFACTQQTFVTNITRYLWWTKPRLRGGRHQDWSSWYCRISIGIRAYLIQILSNALNLKSFKSHKNFQMRTKMGVNFYVQRIMRIFSGKLGKFTPKITRISPPIRNNAFTFQTDDRLCGADGICPRLASKRHAVLIAVLWIRIRIFYTVQIRIQPFWQRKNCRL